MKGTLIWFLACKEFRSSQERGGPMLQLPETILMIVFCSLILFGGGYMVV